jgi:hypothetical protein
LALRMSNRSRFSVSASAVSTWALLLFSGLVVGTLAVIEVRPLVARYNAAGLVGLATFYRVMELAPFAVGMAYLVRTGADNARSIAEAVQPAPSEASGSRDSFLDGARSLSVVLALLPLVLIGSVVALAAAAMLSRLMLGVEVAVFYHSIVDNARAADFGHALARTAIYGTAVMLTSCGLGASVRSGARAASATMVLGGALLVLLHVVIYVALR